MIWLDGLVSVENDEKRDDAWSDFYCIHKNISHLTWRSSGIKIELDSNSMCFSRGTVARINYSETIIKHVNELHRVFSSM